MIDIFILWSIGREAREKGRSLGWVLVGLAAELFFGFVGVAATDSRLGFVLGILGLIGVRIFVGTLDSRNPAWATENAREEPVREFTPISLESATALPSRIEARELTAEQVLGKGQEER